MKYTNYKKGLIVQFDHSIKHLFWEIEPQHKSDYQIFELVDKVKGLVCDWAYLKNSNNKIIGVPFDIIKEYKITNRLNEFTISKSAPDPNKSKYWIDSTHNEQSKESVSVDMRETLIVERHDWYFEASKLYFSHTPLPNTLSLFIEDKRDFKIIDDKDYFFKQGLSFITFNRHIVPIGSKVVAYYKYKIFKG